MRVIILTFTFQTFSSIHCQKNNRFISENQFDSLKTISNFWIIVSDKNVYLTKTLIPKFFWECISGGVTPLGIGFVSMGRFQRSGWPQKELYGHSEHFLLYPQSTSQMIAPFWSKKELVPFKISTTFQITASFLWCSKRNKSL